MPPDILPPNAPALSATSDMPGAPVPAPEPAPVPEPVTPPVPVPDPAPAPVDPPAPKPEPVAKRISEVTQLRREAEARAAEANSRADRLEGLLTKALDTIEKNKSSTPSAATPPDTLARPLRESYDTDAAYDAALVSWAGEQAAAKATEEMQRRQAEAKAEADRIAEETRVAEEARAEQARIDAIEVATNEAWEERCTAAIEKYPDFAAVARNDSLPISTVMGHVIKNSEDGVDIAYYLGKHPEEAAKIAAMVLKDRVFPQGHPMAGLPMPDVLPQIMAMAKLAAKLGLEPVAKPTPAEVNALTSTVPTVPAAPAVPVTPTRAVLPEPPSPISGGSAAATMRDLTEIGNSGSMEEYAAKRTPQLLAERRPGRGLH